MAKNQPPSPSSSVQNKICITKSGLSLPAMQTTNNNNAILLGHTCISKRGETPDEDLAAVKIVPEKIGDAEILRIHETSPELAFLFRGVNLAPMDNMHGWHFLFFLRVACTHAEKKKMEAG
jgi:hypothetical protein